MSTRQVWNDQRKTSICANLSSTQGSIVTPRGTVSGAWTCGGTYGSSLCGSAKEHNSLELACPAGSPAAGKIEKIEVAYYGTPTGSCTTGPTLAPRPSSLIASGAPSRA